MDKCEYQEGFGLPENRTAVENHLVKRYCEKPGIKWEYWIMCETHIKKVTERFEQIKKGKLVTTELKIQTVRR